VTVSDVDKVPMLLTGLDPVHAVGLIARNTDCLEAATFVISSNAAGQLIWYGNVADVPQDVLRT
jgi:hypothetical protein